MAAAVGGSFFCLALSFFSRQEIWENFGDNFRASPGTKVSEFNAAEFAATGDPFPGQVSFRRKFNKMFSIEGENGFLFSEEELN